MKESVECIKDCTEAGELLMVTTDYDVL